MNQPSLKKMTGLGAPIALQDLLASIFSSDEAVILAAADYLKAYAIDCMFTAIFFCYTGFYNGIGRTRFVMLQGIIGAFGVRVPVSYFMSLRPNPSLFEIGLATPMSSIHCAVDFIPWIYGDFKEKRKTVVSRNLISQYIICV